MDSRALQTLLDIRAFAMPGGSVDCSALALKQSGEMREGPGRPWRRFEASERLDARGLDFRWDAELERTGFLRRSVSDRLIDAHGRASSRVFGVPVLARRGAAADKLAVMRALAELPWRPMGFVHGGPLRWSSLETGLLRASYDDGRTRAQVDFETDEDGRVLGARGVMPRASGMGYADTPWAAVFSGYHPFGSFRVPTWAAASWVLDGRPFDYWRARVTSFEGIAAEESSFVLY